MAKVQIIDRPRRWDAPFARQRLPAEAVAGIMRMPVFAGLERRAFPDDLQPQDIIANDCRIRSFRGGDTIYAAGAYQTSLFVVLNGSVRMQTAPCGD